MWLKSLQVNNFRNLRNSQIELDKRVNLFVGKNAQGKTSFLEAIYLLAHTRSFRESKIKEVINWANPESECLISGDLIDQDGVLKNISCAMSDKRRAFSINGNRASSATQFYGTLKVVQFTPDDLFLVRGEPQRRRDFIDRTISLIDKRYLQSLISYQKALKNRNAILKDAEDSNAAVWESLKPWTEVLFQHGAYLAEKRHYYIDELSKLVSYYYQQLVGLISESDKVSLSYKGDFYLRDQFLNLEQALKIYHQELSKERATKRTSFGPHRDDLFIAHAELVGEKEARRSASQGQARSIALSLKLAAVDLIKRASGEMPILLLDDVESELDSNRVELLYKLISEHRDGQVLITSVDSGHASSKLAEKGKIFQIKSGEIVQYQRQKSTSENYLTL